MLEVRDTVISDKSYLTTHKVKLICKLSCDKRTPQSLTQQKHSKIEIGDSTPVILQTVMKYDC
jgi:hypothetical protein